MDGRGPVMKKKKNNERPADLLFWFKDGFCGGYRARVPADTEISIGRTDSKRALGFLVRIKGETQFDFVLNRDQVGELIAYLQLFKPGLLKPLGRKPSQLSFASAFFKGAKRGKP